MSELYAQGDILFERISSTGLDQGARPDGQLVIAEGEATGHRHIINGGATMFRDDAMARDIASELYVGHVRVGKDGSAVEHDEHAPLFLPAGTYRVRRQRELQPQDVSLVAD